MKVGVIGSRNLQIDNLEAYLPENTTEIISGGAKGIDTCAREYAEKKSIPFTEILPEYHKYGKRAPLLRNMDIVHSADMVVAFWDGVSRGTKFTIGVCREENVPLKVVLIERK